MTRMDEKTLAALDAAAHTGVSHPVDVIRLVDEVRELRWLLGCFATDVVFEPKPTSPKLPVLTQPDDTQPTIVVET